MSILTIKIYPDKILRKKAQPIDEFNEKLRRLASDMIETMRHAEGVGLAGPQVGVSKRIVVIEAVENNKEPLILVNPRLLKKKDRSRFCEGCLSLPGVTSEVIRPKSVIVEFCDLKGKILTIEEDGILARIVQHEIDHLNGVLFIDHLGALKRKKLVSEVATNM